MDRSSDAAPAQKRLVTSRACKSCLRSRPHFKFLNDGLHCTECRTGWDRLRVRACAEGDGVKDDLRNMKVNDWTRAQVVLATFLAWELGNRKNPFSVADAIRKIKSIHVPMPSGQTYTSYMKHMSGKYPDMVQKVVSAASPGSAITTGYIMLGYDHRVSGGNELSMAATGKSSDSPVSSGSEPCSSSDSPVSAAGGSSGPPVSAAGDSPVSAAGGSSGSPGSAAGSSLGSPGSASISAKAATLPVAIHGDKKPDDVSVVIKPAIEALPASATAPVPARAIETLPAAAASPVPPLASEARPASASSSLANPGSSSDPRPLSQANLMPDPQISVTKCGDEITVIVKFHNRTQ